MIHRARQCVWLTAILLLAPAAVRAQMTVSGRVTSATGSPIRDAAVTISALGVASRTSADGSYSFIIRSAQVMGQEVALTARHGRFGSQTVRIRIVGGALTQDFVLGVNPARADSTRGGVAPADPSNAPARRRIATASASAAAARLAPEVLSAPDLPTALAGRAANLLVYSSTNIGGTSPMLYRGARSLFGNSQPLVVVDGIAIDNQGFSTIAQRFGLGGFDYGTPLQDLALDDIESVEVLNQATAALRYGSRAANGVLEVHTKRADITGLAVSINQRILGMAATRLPGFQNAFGQGLGGEFEFFDGAGGGINDAVAQSWGPRLDAAAIAQHSLAEPRRPEVRHFLPQPEDVENYFRSGSTWDATVALMGSRDAANVRAAFNARTSAGLTPGSSLTRMGLTLSGATTPVDRLVARANLQVIGTSARQRPGTGYDEINPFSGFARMGRQVDLDALRTRVTDATGAQINWIYTNRNNPFFATARNSNDDKRGQIIASAALAYDITPAIDATLTVGFNDWSETRNARVASGWLGGYQSSLGLGDFSGGGTDQQSVGATEQLVTLSFTGTRNRLFGFQATGVVGGELRSNTFDITSAVTDQPIDGESSSAGLQSDGEHAVSGVFVNATAGRGPFLLSGGVRMERSSSLPNLEPVIYPSATTSYDFAGDSSFVRRSLHLVEAALFTRFWKAGNELTRRTLATGYFGGQPIAPEVDLIGPERTLGVEAGVRMRTTSGHSLDLLAYRERSTEVLVATAPGDGSAVLSQTGQIFNGGIEVTLGTPVISGERFRWEVALNFGRNASTVDALRPGVFNADLAPATFGSSLSARLGSPAGVIVGSRVLRDANGQALLRNGLPIADAAAPFEVLGSVLPEWTAGLQSRMRLYGVDVFASVDARVGGKVFSATNLWGSYAGTLNGTLIGDRGAGAAAADSLTVAGVDSTTGAPNATRVSAEQYFHALAEITEPWVYDATFVKLRELRVSYELPTRFLPGFREHRLQLSIIGRNLLTSAHAPNIDSEPALSASFRGFELGQLPSARAIGVNISVAP